MKLVRAVRLSCGLALALAAACGDGQGGASRPDGSFDLVVEPCGEHGELAGERCACDEGFEEVGQVCVAAKDAAILADDGGEAVLDSAAEDASPAVDAQLTDAGAADAEALDGSTAIDADVAPDAGALCGEHGEQHDDHCHCHEGYREVNGLCVAATDGGNDAEAGPPPDAQADASDGGGDPCAPNGHAHGDHCHCDSGYVASGMSCVPVAAEACGQGHRHGAKCVCYAGHAYDEQSKLCEPVEPPAQQPTLSFAIIALGEDATSSGVNAVNEHLQVVGNKRSSGATALTTYLQTVDGSTQSYAAGSIVDVGVLPHSSNQFSRPWDINWYGVIVGESGNNNPVLPFLFIPGTGLRQLRLPDGSSSAVAHGINDDGVIVGIGNSRAVRWLSSHAIPDYLPLHQGATAVASRAWKINERGDIVGHARNALGQQRATWWKVDGTVEDLGTLHPARVSEALDINEAGAIVGKSFVGVVPGSTSGTLQAQAFLYERGSMRSLGLLASAPSALHSTANAINDQGWVVGQVEQVAGIGLRAVLWRDGVIVDLNSYLPAGSGWVLTSAVDINARGDIVGRGTLNGSARPFALVRTK